MAVVSVSTVKCGNTDCRYDILRMQYVSVCDCGMHYRDDALNAARDALKGHQEWRIVTWLS